MMRFLFAPCLNDDLQLREVTLSMSGELSKVKWKMVQVRQNLFITRANGSHKSEIVKI